MSHVSLKLTFSIRKPVTSKDFKCFDDLDVNIGVAIDIFHGKTRNVESFQVFGGFGCLISVCN